ncbi:MAG: NDP-sugar synthase [Candidatus Rokubacteria bacterium]|nr:NDP-sugar synthase [Candidatus Rokubacteria bacterium]
MPESLPDPRRHPRHADQRGRALDTPPAAVILAGGQGTRLRPLTLACPKPIVPLLNVPFLHYQLALLHRHGVREVVLACSYLLEAVQARLGDGRELGVRLRYAVEAEPLGTAGGVKNAATLAAGRLVVLNGDVLTDVDLTRMLGFHEARGARASLYLTAVEDPTAYGLVETDTDGRIRRFVEKPAREQITTNTVNAGIYLLERELLDLIPAGQVVSMERDFFPTLLERRVPCYGFAARAYWRDTGSPEQYRRAQVDLLKGAVDTPLSPPGTRRGDVWVGAGVSIAPGASVTGPAVLGAGVRLEPEARVGPLSVLGDNVRVGRGGRVEGAILWDNVSVGEAAVLSECVVGFGAVIGKGARVGAGAVVAENEVVP